MHSEHEGSWKEPRRRRGHVLIIVATFSLILFTALMSLMYMTRTDISTNENLQREILATSLAESIAAQIEVQTNTRPWAKRFWLTMLKKKTGGATEASIVPRLVLDKSSELIDLSQDTLPSQTYDFIAIVKDLPSTLREYRIYLEVTLQDSTYTYSWDKRWQSRLLSGLDRDTTQLDRVVDDSSAAASLDEILDGLKKEAVNSPPRDGSGADQLERLGRLRQDEPSFKASTLTPDPENKPKFGARVSGATAEDAEENFESETPGEAWGEEE